MIDTKNYSEEELTIDPVRAQYLSLLYFLPSVIVFVVPYFILWKSSLTKETIKQLLVGHGLYSILIIILAVIVGIVMHELIHGLTCSLYAVKGLRSMKFGVMWKYATPYCHCKEPLLVKYYITGALMPAIVLGILPSVVALFIGNLGLLIFGLFFTMAAGGDFMIINLLRKEPANNLVQDHPTKIGCYVYRSKTV